MDPVHKIKSLETPPGATIQRRIAFLLSLSFYSSMSTYDQGMGNRGEVFMTWEGFEPGTWSLELWDLKRFELGTL